MILLGGQFFVKDNFDWGERFFPVVTLLTADDDVAFCADASPRQGDDMVHGEFFSWKTFPAIVAFAFIQLGLPPGGLTQLARLFLLPFDGFWVRPVKQGFLWRTGFYCSFHKT